MPTVSLLKRDQLEKLAKWPLRMECASKTSCTFALPSDLVLFLCHKFDLPPLVIRSIFCLSPAGDTPSSARLFDAIVSGCIPVIVSDELELPFEGIIDYRKVGF